MVKKRTLSREKVLETAELLIEKKWPQRPHNS